MPLKSVIVSSAIALFWLIALGLHAPSTREIAYSKRTAYVSATVESTFPTNCCTNRSNRAPSIVSSRDSLNVASTFWPSL